MNEYFINICIFLGQHYVRTIFLLLPLLLFPIFWQRRTQKKHKSAMINDDISSYIDSYLEMSEPGFSVFINGEWGSGKTYFIKQYERNSKSHKKSCYVSLFGISSKGEFEFAIWKGILCSDSTICCTLLWSLLSITISSGFILYDFKALAHIEFWSFVFSVVPVVCIAIWCFAKLQLRDFMLKNRYLVLDDFERAEVEYPILMAWISELVEHRCCPVIVIGNECEIKRKLNADTETGQDTSAKNSEGKMHKPAIDSFKCVQYKRMKEKVIGKEFSLSQNDELVLNALISELPSNSSLQEILTKHSEWVVALVLSPLHDNKIATNYRALEHVMHDFEWHFSELEDFIKNKTICELLIPRYFSLMYFREVQELPEVGKFDAGEILNSYMRLYKDSVPADKFFEFYPFWRDQFLTPAMWREILQGNALDTKTFCSFFESYLSPDATPRWNQVYKLEDDKLDELVNNTKCEFRNPNVHYSPEDILSLSKAILDFQFTAPNYSGLNGIKQIILDYISREKDSEYFANYIKCHISYPILKDDILNMDMKGHPALGDFEEIKNAVISAVEFTHELVQKRGFADLLTHIADEKCNFKKWYAENNLRYTDLFSGRSPQKLWDALKNIPTRLFVERMEILRGHIISVVIEKSNPEIQFWKDFIELAMATRDQWMRDNKNYCKQFKIKQFAEMVGSRFKSLVGSEENNAAAEARDV